MSFFIISSFRSPLQKTFSMRASKKRKTTRPIVATVKGSDVEDNEKTQDKTNGVHSHHNELNKNSSIAKSSQTSSNTSTIEIAPANGSNVEQRADNVVVDSNKENYIETIADGNNGNVYQCKQFRKHFVFAYFRLHF